MAIFPYKINLGEYSLIAQLSSNSTPTSGQVQLFLAKVNNGLPEQIINPRFVLEDCTYNGYALNKMIFKYDDFYCSLSENGLLNYCGYLNDTLKLVFTLPNDEYSVKLTTTFELAIAEELAPGVMRGSSPIVAFENDEGGGIV